MTVGNTPYTRTLQLAADTLGGTERLADLLSVEHARLLKWISGEEYPPHEVFLEALDIVAKGPSARHAFPGGAQARADRQQERADRSQARADRDQSRADRAQKEAERTRNRAGQSALRGGAQHFRQVEPRDGESASNKPEDQSKKGSGT